MAGPLAIDPITAAAFALCSRPGAYAVLAGSGVSSGAGLPTGWQVLERLVRELATVEGAPADADPFLWFKGRYGVEPSYSLVIESLGLTEAERQALVRRALYGDGPSPSPSPAHRSLARLVAGGWVRIVLTTNFDRLIETALVDAGVDVTTLSTPEAIRGSLPLVHAGVLVVKLHGDQGDPTIRNTEYELSQYPPEVDQLLDRVVDEFGLIVCGWSADHDAALRVGLDRATTRRFTSYWATRSPLRGAAADLAHRRQAEIIEGIDGDEFFGRLVDACEALTVTRRAAPVSVAADVAIAKRELSGGEVAISLHDRLRREIQRVRGLKIFTPDRRSDGNDQLHVLDEMVGETERLVALVATAAYWGGAETDRWWLGEIGRMATRRTVGGSLAVIDRPRLPALLIAWSGGIAGLAAGRDDLLTALFGLPFVSDPFRGEPIPPLVALTPEIFHTHDEIGRLFRILRPVFVEHLALGREAFVDAWERFQYLLCVASMEARLFRDTSARLYIEGIRIDSDRRRTEPVPHKWMLDEIARLDGDHPLLAGGLFEGSVEVLQEGVDTTLSRIAEAAQSKDDFVIDRGVVPSGCHYPGEFVDDPDQVFGAMP